MISINNLLTGMYIGDKFIRGVYLGNSTILEREIISPKPGAGTDVFGNAITDIDTDYLKLTNVTYGSPSSSRYSLTFGVDGVAEITKVVDSMCLSGVNSHFVDNGIPVGSDSYHIILSNAITGEQMFRFAIKATAQSSVVDYTFKVTAYDKNDKETISTSYSAISGIIRDIMVKYNSGGYYIKLADDNDGVDYSVVGPYTPLKLQVKNVSGRSTLPPIYFKANDEVDGLGIYKSYSVK